MVINLGQNDQCGSEPDLTMTASMEDFVRAIRAKFPATQIVVMRSFGGPFAADESAAVQELNAGGDSHVHCVDTTGWLDPKTDFVDGVHPNPVGQAKAAQRLIPSFFSRLFARAVSASGTLTARGWTAVRCRAGSR